MADPRDNLDLTSGSPVKTPEKNDTLTGRPWLGLFFRCAGVYGRAYRNAEGTAYVGRCPKCGKTVRFKVGSGGTSERMFKVSC